MDGGQDKKASLADLLSQGTPLQKAALVTTNVGGGAYLLKYFLNNMNQKPIQIPSILQEEPHQGFDEKALQKTVRWIEGRKSEPGLYQSHKKTTQLRSSVGSKLRSSGNRELKEFLDSHFFDRKIKHILQDLGFDTSVRKSLDNGWGKTADIQQM